MMSKKQWFVLLCLYVTYLLLGASFFYQVESREELLRKAAEKIERKEIEELLKIHYVPTLNETQQDIFQKLTEYCGKPIHFNMSHTEDPMRWDFYHSLFFVVTVGTTVGYGNLAPTVTLSRVFMMFFALIGIPINGILMVTMGEFFAKKFIKVYRRWKTDKMREDITTFSLIGQITLYLVPGFTILIFIPSVIIMVFEQWPYEVAVYYAFVTLTTIGFGDIVAGVQDNNFGHFSFTAYKIFLLIWIIVGLGYVLMVLSFISRGLRSKRMRAIEHALSQNIKRTPDKFRELRTVLHEMLLWRVKPVYKKKSICVPARNFRSYSCPDLTLYESADSPQILRRRAFSIAHQDDTQYLHRGQSDTDLTLIDKDLTFSNEIDDAQTKLLLKVSNVLSSFETMSNNSFRGIDGFSSREILESERYGSELTVNSHKVETPTLKFADETNYDNNKTWYGENASLKEQEMREKMKHGRARSRTLPVQQEPLIPIPEPRFLDRLRKTFSRTSSIEKDVEKQEVRTPKSPPKRNRAVSECPPYLARTRQGRPSVFSLEDEDNITAVAELILTLATSEPKRKLGTASLTPPDSSPTRERRLGISSMQSRRSSMTPTHGLAPPPYTPVDTRPRRYSLKPVPTFSSTPSPVQRIKMRTNADSIKE